MEHELPVESQSGSPAPAESAQTPITLTDKAVEMAKAHMQRDGRPGYGLRVGVQGGGCSGLEYHLGFEPEAKPGDFVFEVNGLRVFLDEASRQHLQGVTIDYAVALHGAGFKFINPNASRTCGCGSSFAP